MRILVLNGGSSSLKATLRALDPAMVPAAPPAPLWRAEAEWGRPGGRAMLRAQGPEDKLEKELSIPSSAKLRPGAEVLKPLIESLWSGPARALSGPGGIDAVGHRVVHGGRAFQQSTRVTAEVRAGIRQSCEFAPEHNRLELDAIEEAERILGPMVPQFAVFDTQFHSTMPLAAKLYPGPFEWYEQGIRRYGFHGISHQFVARRAAELLGRPVEGLRLVSCHLGNGASAAAVRDGRSIDTTMGFTPLEGLMMGTRSGTIDPGIIIHLVRHSGLGAAALDGLLNHESGLKGVSGISGDMRDILAASQGDARARLAFDVYIHRLCREIGGMVSSLGGMDALVFTAGVGENCPPVRAAVCEQLAFLGIQLDAERNAAPDRDADIAAADSRVRVLVIRTDEDWEIARECVRLLA